MDTYPGYRPTATQELLLQAALLPQPQAAAAWQAWNDQVHLENDTLDVSSYLLLPAVYANLAGQMSDFPWRARLQGVWRRAWVEAQLHTNACLPLLASLRQAIIPYLLIPGDPPPVAPNSAAHPAAPLGKFEVLLHPSYRREVMDRVLQHGWQPDEQIRKRVIRILTVAPTFQDFSDSAHNHLRLRWHLFDMPGAALSPYRHWSSPATMPISHLTVTALALHQRLPYLAFAATTWTPRPRVELIPPFVASIRAAGEAMEWDALLQAVAVSPAQPFVCGLVAYASQRLGLSVPPPVLAALAQMQVASAGQPIVRLHSRRSPGASWAQRA